MKAIQPLLLALAVVIAIPIQNACAVTGTQISIQDNDVVLRWPSQPCQVFIIGYRQAFDPSTPWTILEDAYVASAGEETTFVQPDVVVFPAGASGGGEENLSVESQSAQTYSYSKLTDKQLAILLAERQIQALASADYLTALLKEAVANSEENIERWIKEGPPVTQAGANPTETSAAQAPLGSMGFYFVAEYTADADGDGLRNSVEVAVGLNLLLADSDGDSILDGDEDLDEDGVSNFEEVLSGTLLTEPDGEYPPPLLPFGTVYFIEEEFTLTCEPSGGGAAVSQDMLFLDASPDMAHGITAIETSPGVLNVKLHSIYIGPEFGAFALENFDPPQNPFPRPSEEQLALLKQANGETDIGSGRIGNISQEIYDQLDENTLDWAGWSAEYGLRRTERLVQEIESGQRQANAAFRRSLRANLVTQAKRLTAATSSLARRFGRAVGRYLPAIGGIMILSSASAIAQDWQMAFEDYASDIRNGFDTTGSAAIIAALSNDLAPGSQNFVLNALLR